MATGLESECRFIGLTPIDISKEDLESLKKFLKSPKASAWVKDNKIKKMVGSWCVLCGGLPTKIGTYDYAGATRLERYCDSCEEKQFPTPNKK